MVVTKVFQVDPLNPDENAVRECCRILVGGGIVVFPTETVYGLGASVYSVEGLRKVFIAKQRPPDNPLIIHISKLDHLYEVATDVPKFIEKLSEYFWPGPLTVVLKKAKHIPPEVSGGLDTVAVRMPAHPVALKLIDCAGPIAAPSANIAGRPSPTEPHHVYVDMYGRADAILDAGETFFGVESTIIDLLSSPPRLLRPGPIPVEKVVEALGVEIEIPMFAKGYVEAEKALAPGMRYKHYMPNTPLVLVKSSSYSDLKEYSRRVMDVARGFISKGERVAIVASRETAEMYRDLDVHIVVIGSRGNLYEVAKNLFSVLRELDRMPIDVAIAEGYPEKGVGLAIMNKLIKASNYRVIEV